MAGLGPYISPAERVARYLSERLGKEAVTAHHGSTAKEQRLTIHWLSATLPPDEKARLNSFSHKFYNIGFFKETKMEEIGRAHV